MTLPKELYIEKPAFKALNESDQHLLGIMYDIIKEIEFNPMNRSNRNEKNDKIQLTLEKKIDKKHTLTQFMSYYPTKNFIDPAANAFMGYTNKIIKLK